ncbi:hypothetical protein PR048_017521 [Dryococelus australis]|uniref:Uncharacterized protein n=1 Tax=Dryococelus australis TaxID=614101 RepID=A0ABQ9HAC8_9NEOP|nr:hypothetical protein PR048_017521 [Dryococelus australis]
MQVHSPRLDIRPAASSGRHRRVHQRDSPVAEATSTGQHWPRSLSMALLTATSVCVLHTYLEVVRSPGFIVNSLAWTFRRGFGTNIPFCKTSVLTSETGKQHRWSPRTREEHGGCSQSMPKKSVFQAISSKRRNKYKPSRLRTKKIAAFRKFWNSLSRLPRMLSKYFPHIKLDEKKSGRGGNVSTKCRLHHCGSKLDSRSDLRSTQKTVAPFEFRTGLEIEIKFNSNRRNWRFEISIRDQQPSGKKILIAADFELCRDLWLQAKCLTITADMQWRGVGMMYGKQCLAMIAHGCESQWSIRLKARSHSLAQPIGEWLMRPHQRNRRLRICALVCSVPTVCYSPFTVTFNFSEVLLMFYFRDIPPHRASKAQLSMGNYTKGTAHRIRARSTVRHDAPFSNQRTRYGGRLLLAQKLTVGHCNTYSLAALPYVFFYKNASLATCPRSAAGEMEYLDGNSREPIAASRKGKIIRYSQCQSGKGNAENGISSRSTWPRRNNEVEAEVDITETISGTIETDMSNSYRQPQVSERCCQQVSIRMAAGNEMEGKLWKVLTAILGTRRAVALHSPITGTTAGTLRRPTAVAYYRSRHGLTSSSPRNPLSSSASSRPAQMATQLPYYTQAHEQKDGPSESEELVQQTKDEVGRFRCLSMSPVLPKELPKERTMKFTCFSNDAKFGLEAHSVETETAVGELTATIAASVADLRKVLQGDDATDRDMMTAAARSCWRARLEGWHACRSVLKEEGPVNGAGDLRGRKAGRLQTLENLRGEANSPVRQRASMATSYNQVIEASMKQGRNERGGGKGDPREKLPTSGIVRHDSHMRKPGSEQANRSATAAPVTKNSGEYCQLQPHTPTKWLHQPTISYVTPSFINHFSETVARRQLDQYGIFHNVQQAIRRKARFHSFARPMSDRVRLHKMNRHAISLLYTYLFCDRRNAIAVACKTLQ